MPFDPNNLPEWNAPGVEPPQSKKDSGWGPTEKPPADWFNWFFNKTFKALQSLFTNAQHKEEKGQPNGYASLDGSGKVPTSQLPAMNYIPISEKGAPNGVATLGPDGKVPSEQLSSDAATKDELTHLNVNIIDMAVELETLKGATLNGVTANIFIETFQNLNDINLMNGIYDNINKRLVL